jgi:lysophospholipase L1-like esterase
MALLYRDTMTGTAGNNLHSRASDQGGTFTNYGGGNFVLKAGGGCYASGSARIVAPVDVTDIEIEAIMEVMSTGVANNYGGTSLAVNSGAANVYIAQFFNYSTASYAHWFQMNKAGTVDNPYLADNPTDDIYFAAGGGLQTSGRYKVNYSREGNMFRSWIDGRELTRVIPSSTYLPAFNFGGLFSDGGSSNSTTGLHWRQFDIYNTRNDYNQIQFVGDSMVACDYFAPGILRTPVAQQWPTRVMADLYADGWEGRWANVGVDGKRLDTMETNATATPTDVTALSQEVNISGATRGWGVDVVLTDEDNDLVVLAGYNDIAQGANAATVISRMTTYVNSRIAAGHRVYVCTIVHCDWNLATAGAVSNVTGNGIVDTVNTAILALSGLEGVIRLDLVTELMDYTNATYRSATDGIHWLPAAQQFVASEVYDVVQPVLMASGGAQFFGSGCFGAHIIGG